MSKALYELSASEVIALTRSDQLTVVDYARALLERCRARDPVVHGWAYLSEDAVLASARALDALPANQRGPLHGVAVGVKDIFYTLDMPTQHYSPIYKDDHPKIDAAVVMTLRQSGALIFGKTHTTEFATCLRGPPTNNPHDPTRTPGGSSSGSGAVVGDFQVPLAIGTQTGGSIIRPAGFNGVYALKPTYNAISREGSKIYSITCDTVGLYSRNVDDLSLLCDVLRLRDDVPPPPQPLDLSETRFGFTRTHMWDKAQPDLVDIWERAKAMLTAAGADVEEVDLPGFGEVTPWHRNIMHMEGQGSFLGEWLKAPELLDPLVTKHAENGFGTTRREQVDSYDGMARLRPVIDKIASSYTALITPSTTGEAPVMEDANRFTGDSAFNQMWTVLHLPVLHIPGFVSSNGLPIGLSVVAPRYHEQDLLRTGRAVARIFAQGGWKLSPRI